MVDAGMVLANRYWLRERLEAGGGGDAWRAADLLLGREAAVRLLQAEDTKRVERFLAAARRAARLSHPGIIRVQDYGLSDPGGLVFLVTELVGASSVATLIQAGPLDYRWVLEVVSQIASALEEAHAAGLVHQRIRAETLLLAPGGTVKLTDFGPSHTVEPAAATPADDIYALGMVAAECLTGAPLPAGVAELLADLTAMGLRARTATAAEVAARSRGLLAVPLRATAAEAAYSNETVLVRCPPT
jgi:eukaryotic-like serine/threonine-protein kinase